MTTSRTSAMDTGFEKAVKAYFDEAIKMASAGRDRRAVEVERSNILTSDRGKAEMLAILDDQDSDYLMTLSVARFYSGWSPDVWKARALHPLYPFAFEQKHATKGAIDQWVLLHIEAKHSGVLNDMGSPEWGRAPMEGRPYVVDMASGHVICDGVISGIEKRHSTTLGKSDLEIRYHTFSEALKKPWQDEAMRKIWVRGYRRYLVAMTKLAAKELATFDREQDRAALQRNTAKALGQGKRLGI